MSLPDQIFLNRETGTEPEIAEGVLISGYIDCIGKVKIDKDAFFGHDVMLLTGGHDYTQFGYDRRLNGVKGSIHIKEGAWIASRAIILGKPKGTVIGKHSVVGAGSVVTKSIPDYEVWAGNPCKFIKKIKHL